MTGQHVSFRGGNDGNLQSWAHQVGLLDLQADAQPEAQVIIADTPESIRLMGLITLKRDLKLQSKGFTFRRGYNPRKFAKQVLKTKENNFEKLIELVEVAVQDLGKNPEARFKS